MSIDSAKLRIEMICVYFYLFPAFRGGIGNVKCRKFPPNDRPKNQSESVLSRGEIRFPVSFS